MSLKDIKLKPSYNGISQNLINSFYKPCIEESVIYKRSTAYFTGGVYSLAASSYKKFFLDNDGVVQLVTSPFFDSKVRESFNNPIELTENKDLLVSVLEDTLAKLENSEKGLEIIELISLLINLKKLSIKIAVVPEPGMHHEKIGIFEDSFRNSVSFSGSVNETWSGWISNSEEFKVFNNWDLSKKYWERDILNFEELWHGRRHNVKTIDLPDAIEKNIIKVVSNPSIEKLEGKIDVLNHIIEEEIKEKEQSNQPETEDSEYRKTLMPHQQQVLDSWIKNNKQGLIIHATGSGKTITGIHAIKEWLKIENVALVIVPSILLLEQWSKEIESELTDINLFVAGGEIPKSNWIKSLKFISAPNMNEKIVVLSTLATASSSDFRSAFKWGEHVLVVIDEVHRVGSRKSSNLLSDSKHGASLGLSATPERYGDEEGTAKIFEYFKNVLEPEFSLNDAIRVGRLVPYEYFPKTVELTEQEQESYDVLTDRIVSIYHMLENDFSNKNLQDQYKRLLIQRARILKQASKKPELALKIIENNFSEGEHWLVYCDDTNQLNSVINTLSSQGIRTFKYTSAMLGDRPQTLEMFKYKAGVLVAIKCLDEGVDLPYLSHAVILASSKNPREHIQRRGRVLRKSDGKYSSSIYDAIVLPNKNTANLENDSIMMGELQRAISFAEGASNPSSKIELIQLAQRFNIKIDKLTSNNLEEE